MSLAAQNEMDLLCSVSVGGGWFGVLTTDIIEVLGAATPHLVPLAPVYIDGVIPYRGEVLTTISFRALLGLERGGGLNCVLVVEDEENEERFGLAVDAVGGVVSFARGTLEPNPSTLDARSAALFRGTYRMARGLMVRLDPRSMSPARIAESGLFGVAKQAGNGEWR